MRIAAAYVEIDAKTTKYKQNVSKLKRTTKKDVSTMNKIWEKHGKTIKKIGVGIAGVGALIATGFALTIRTVAKFEQSMANTQSVIGGTADELKKLTAFAREMGKQSVFSASEAADAMYFLGSAGLRTNQIMGALKGTLSLAAATQSDLAFTTSVVASNLSAFGLEAAEADRISNVFAATISASQATMTKLATALAIIGPVARSTNMSLEQTSGILATLFNNGIDASTAGTALRMAIARLLKPSREAVTTLDRLNISISDNEGNMRNFVDIVRDLGAAGMKTADAMAIFGVRAGPAMLALVASGADSIEDLTKQVTNTNKAMEMAAIQTDTFTGKTKFLKSAIQDLMIGIGNQVLPTLTDYTEKLTEIINKTSTWATENPRLAKTLVQLTAAIGGTGLAIGGFAFGAFGIAKLVGSGGLLRLMAIDAGIVAGKLGITATAAGGAGLAIADLALIVWAANRAFKAWQIPVDMAAVSTKVMTKNQEQLSRALEDISTAFIKLAEKDLLTVNTTLGELDVNINKINRVLGTNFDKTTNAGLAVAQLEKGLARTTKEVNKLTGAMAGMPVLEVFAPPPTHRPPAPPLVMPAPVISKLPLPEQEFFMKGLPSIYERIAPVRESSDFDRRIQAGIKALEEMGFVVADIQAIPAGRMLEPLKQGVDDYGHEVEKQLDRTEAKAKEGWKAYEDNRAKEDKDATREIIANQKRIAQEQKSRLLQIRRDWIAHTAAIEAAFTDMFANLLSGKNIKSWTDFMVQLKNIALRELAKIAVSKVFDRLEEVYLAIRDRGGGTTTTGGGGGNGGTTPEDLVSIASQFTTGLAPAAPGITVVLPNADIEHMGSARVERVIQREFEPARQRLMKRGIIPRDM